MRAQLSLPALGLAFLVLTAVTVLGVAVADGAVGSTERPALDRQAAVALSDRLVTAEGPLTVRANVVTASAVADLNETVLRTEYGLAAGTDVRITLDGNELVSSGSVDDGVSIERLVVIRERHVRTLDPSFSAGNSVTLPRRTDRVTLSITPGTNTTVSTVRVGDRVVLHNDSGLYGTFNASVSSLETARLTFESTGPLAQGNVSVTYYPVETRKARLGVTVDG
jgi:hypothetical protein